MKYYILPYQKFSESVKELRNNLQAKSIKLINSRWRPKATRLVINWGNSEPPMPIGNNILNRPDAIKVTVSKWDSLTLLHAWGIKVPTFTNDVNVAKSWFDNDKKAVVFCRTLLRSSGGKGIVIAKSKEELVPAPMYTLNTGKLGEYRVHVFQDNVIDVVQKRLRNDAKEMEGRNKYIRNSANGWVYAHNDVVCPDEIKFEALKAVAALKLDFGAVDIAVDKNGSPVVFEVNSAPGLENNKTIKAYTDAFNNYKYNRERQRRVAFGF